MIPIQHFLVLSGILFSLGVYGVLARRSAVLILMSVELTLQAVSISRKLLREAGSKGIGVVLAGHYSMGRGERGRQVNKETGRQVIT